MKDLILLISTISALLADPRVQKNPVFLAQATLISQEANIIAEDYTAIVPDNTPVSPYQTVQTPQVQESEVPGVQYQPPAVPVPETCTVTANVSGEKDLWSDEPLSAHTEVIWTLNGFPDQWETGTLSDLSGSLVRQIQDPVKVPPYYTWDYFRGGIIARFGDASCTTYFPETWTPTTTTIVSTPTP